MSLLRSPTFTPPPAAWLLGHRSGRGARLVAALALAAAAVALAVAALQYARAVQQLDAAQAAARAVAAPPPAPAASAARLADPARLNRVVRRLNTPWAALFEALEREASPEVALVSIETDAERGAVRVVTEGPALDALLRHAERVQDSPRFVRGQLLRIEPPESGAPPGLSRLSFDLVLAR